MGRSHWQGLLRLSSSHVLVQALRMPHRRLPSCDLIDAGLLHDVDEFTFIDDPICILGDVKSTVGVR